MRRRKEEVVGRAGSLESVVTAGMRRFKVTPVTHNVAEVAASISISTQQT
jgi:hypothetical protein